MPFDIAAMRAGVFQLGWVVEDDGVTGSVNNSRDHLSLIALSTNPNFHEGFDFLLDDFHRRHDQFSEDRRSCNPRSRFHQQ